MCSTLRYPFLNMSRIILSCVFQYHFIVAVRSRPCGYRGRGHVTTQIERRKACVTVEHALLRAASPSRPSRTPLPQAISNPGTITTPSTLAGDPSFPPPRSPMRSRRAPPPPLRRDQGPPRSLLWGVAPRRPCHRRLRRRRGCADPPPPLRLLDMTRSGWRGGGGKRAHAVAHVEEKKCLELEGRPRGAALLETRAPR